MSCLSTIGSSWADLWAVDKLQTWMKPTLFYQDFPNLPRTIHRSILSSLPSADCQSSFSRVLNLGLRGKNKLTQGILFGNIQELAAVVQLCWPCSLSLRKDSLDEWAETCPCLFPRKRPKFQAQAHYSPRAQKFHLHRGFHWITLNSFRGGKKKRTSSPKSHCLPQDRAWHRGVANHSSISISMCGHRASGSQEGQPRSPSWDQEGSRRDCCSPGFFQACSAEAWTSEEQGPVSQTESDYKRQGKKR